MKLTAEKVEEILTDCLFTDEEDKTDRVEVDGIVNKYGFHPGRLQQHEQEILDLLFELSPNFRQSGGGGWSFLQACYDKEGNHWGEHVNMEQLFVLGMAIRRVRPLFPREFWDTLPGQMPYYVITDQKMEKP